MITMQPGFKAKLDDVVNTGETVSVELAIAGNDAYLFSCFGLDGNGNLYKEEYFISAAAGNLNSPANEITSSQSNSDAIFNVNLPSLPSGVQKLAFTISIEDGQGTMGDIRYASIKINQNNVTALQLDLTGSDFQKQTAIIALEIYQKDVWRVAAIADGFNGGLEDLLRHYGYKGEIESEGPANPPQPAPSPRQPSPVRSEAPRTAAPVSSPPPPPGSSTRRPVPGDDDYFEAKESDWI